jgi:hypothetical protein
MEVDPLISANTPLTQIIIRELDAQQTLNNTSNIQINPLVNPPNIIIDDIEDITLESCVGLHMTINTNAPQVVDPSLSSPKATIPKRLA